MTPPQPLLSGDPCFLSPRQQHGRSCMELAGSSPPAAAEFAGDLALAVLVHDKLPQAELRGGLCSGDDARRGSTTAPGCMLLATTLAWGVTPALTQRLSADLDNSADFCLVESCPESPLKLASAAAAPERQFSFPADCQHGDPPEGSVGAGGICEGAGAGRSSRVLPALRCCGTAGLEGLPELSPDPGEPSEGHSHPSVQNFFGAQPSPGCNQHLTQ